MMSDPKRRATDEKSSTTTEMPDGAEDIEGGEAEKPGQSEHDEKQTGEERT
jgi:hypothetical protein